MEKVTVYVVLSLLVVYLVLNTVEPYPTQIGPEPANFVKSFGKHRIQRSVEEDENIFGFAKWLADKDDPNANSFRLLLAKVFEAIKDDKWKHNNVGKKRDSDEDSTTEKSFSGLDDDDDEKLPKLDDDDEKLPKLDDDDEKLPKLDDDDEKLPKLDDDD